MSGKARIATLLWVLAGCAARVDGLEQAIHPETGKTTAASAAAVPLTSGVAGGSYRRGDPDWDPSARVPNLNPRVLTNNVYGPGKSSDRYGRPVYHESGLRIEESALGAGDYKDQYGRPVRCYSSGMGTFCQ